MGGSSARSYIASNRPSPGRRYNLITPLGERRDLQEGGKNEEDWPVKNDKSKNGKAATLVVMYTLKRALDSKKRPVLLGPVNVWRYASYAPKRHAFAIARREAKKRGFAKGCGKTIQIVMDGDPDLELYAGEFFPEASLTLDIAHAVEKLWIAGECLFKEGPGRLKYGWVR